VCACKGNVAVKVREILHRREKGCGPERIARLQKKYKDGRGGKEKILNTRQTYSCVGENFS
jgi:hypothetical protein